MMGEGGRGGNQEYQKKSSDSQFKNQYQISLLEMKTGHLTRIEPSPSKIADMTAWSKWNAQALTIWVKGLRWSLLVMTRPQASCKDILMDLF